MQHSTANDQTFESEFSSWPKPDPSILDGGLPAPALPLDVFGPFWSEWISSRAEQVSAPADYVAAPLLGVAAAAIGNTRTASPWSGWTEPCILWLAKIGSPSAGKTPSDQPVFSMVTRLEKTLADGFDETLREHETDAVSSRLAREAWESEVKDAMGSGLPPPIMPEAATTPDKPTRPRLKVSDTTLEALGGLLAAHGRGLLFHRDELSGWLGAFDKYGGAGSDRAFWSECYNGSFYVIDRKKHPEPIRIPHLNVSLTGGIQPERLASLLLAGDDDGLPARFLMVWPEPIPPRRPNGLVEDDRAYDALRRLHRLEMGVDGEGQPCRVVVTLAPDAADVFQEWRTEHYENQPSSGLFASHYGKLPGIVLRLALVLEFLWWAAEVNTEPPSTITKRATDAAAGLVSDYFLPMARRAYGDAALPEDERGARTLGRWIVAKGTSTLNASELRRKIKLPGLTKPAAINGALNYLEDAHWIIASPSRQGDTAGRTRSDYSVNPRVKDL